MQAGDWLEGSNLSNPAYWQNLQLHPEEIGPSLVIANVT